MTTDCHCCLIRSALLSLVNLTMKDCHFGKVQASREALAQACSRCRTFQLSSVFLCDEPWVMGQASRRFISVGSGSLFC